VSEEYIDATEYEGQTTITLDNEAIALVITPKGYHIYIPKLDDEEEVPTYMVFTAGIAGLLSNDAFVKRVLEIAYSDIENVGAGA